MSDYRLILFDLDDTLSPFNSDDLFPDAAQWFRDNPMQAWAIVSNQGGIGLRYWMETEGFGNPADYPTLDDFYYRIERLFPQIPADEYDDCVYICARYQSQKSGKWSPRPQRGGFMSIWRQDWRKPAPGCCCTRWQCAELTRTKRLWLAIEMKTGWRLSLRVARSCGRGSFLDVKSPQKARHPNVS